MYIDYNERNKLYKYQNKLYRKLKNIFIDIHNNRYVANMIKQNLKVNGYSLDNEQKRAIVSDEVNTLVVAGAGSGKSLTIIGKINYLIDKGISPNEILCISLTNDACNSLMSKLKYDIEVLTFHKLALKIIGYNKYRICPSNYLNYIIDEYFNSIIYNNQDMIDKVLKTAGQIISYDKYIKMNEFNNLKKTILIFINLFKANNYNFEYFCRIDTKKYHDLLSIIIDIYLLYKQELYYNNYIDFDDMISYSTEDILNGKVCLKYKYIIIDEFQDTSLVKLNLIKSIASSCGAKTFVVGDDFQSIYRFTGCDLDIFLNYPKYIGSTKTFLITHTYRNSQQLVNVATKFILKNKHQIKKYIKSDKRRNKPIKIVNYKSNILKELLDYLISIGEEEILLLGRNNNDIIKYLDDDIKQKQDKIIYKKNDINIRYLTVHKAKGLESECVVVLNLSDDILGFPCKLKNPEILNLINKNELYPYEEERRLFYVALTRTKKDIYLICPINLSIFVKEIMLDNNRNIEYLTFPLS